MDHLRNTQIHALQVHAVSFLLFEGNRLDCIPLSLFSRYDPLTASAELSVHCHTCIPALESIKLPAKELPIWLDMQEFRSRDG